MLAKVQPVTVPATRYLDIEFLFLDLTTCTRCVGTNKNLETALNVVAKVLDLTNVQVNIRKIHVETAEQAQAHHFVSSPTIRVNGRDIALDSRESRCDSCTDLCGCAEGTDCRVWYYQDREYDEAPVGLIVEAILQEAFRPDSQMPDIAPHESELPANLGSFFAAVKEQAAPAACCSTGVQATCCEPSAKASCCGETAVRGSCGCQ